MDFEEHGCTWMFLGFQSPTEGQPVQSWFDNLIEEHRDEIKDRLNIMQVMPRSEWEDPDNALFDPLIGEGGISEIRFDQIICVRGKFYYRIYGFFGPEEEESYNFLHAVNKRKRNDKHGKAIAKRRLEEIQNSEAGLHPFDMD